MMYKKLQGKINIFVAKSPKKAVLIGILIFNLIFIFIAAAIIAALSQHISGLNQCGFWESVYYTITMILDAGCIGNVIADVGQAGAFAAIVCLAVVVMGMIVLTGAVIGYITNVITDFIESKNNGENKLRLSGHIVFINWNSRGIDIINEYLYAKKSITIVVFVPDNREEVDQAIKNRLDTTLLLETEQVLREAEHLSGFERKLYLKKNLPKSKLTYIVREGDVTAANDLDNISISTAQSVIIMDKPRTERLENGNAEIIKTLIQISEISKGNENQKIIVEINDKWTWELVQNIIAFRSKDGVESIIPIPYDRLLGKINAQIAIVPELNVLYNNLFSNKGAHFEAENVPQGNSGAKGQIYIEQKFAESCQQIPMTVMQTSKGDKGFFMAGDPSRQEDNEEGLICTEKAQLKNKPVFTFKKRNIMVLGHNSHMRTFIELLDVFRSRWRRPDGSEALEILFIDTAESLAQYQNYEAYPFIQVIAADIYDPDAVHKKMAELIKDDAEKTTIMILSDDSCKIEDADTNVFTHLIYLQQYIQWYELKDPTFKKEDWEIIAEILNPRNESIVKNYGVARVMNSSRMISRIISQITIQDTPFEFYINLMDFDNSIHHSNSRKIFIVPAEDFFEVIPEKCTAAELIRKVYAGGKPEDKSIMLGFIRNQRECCLFYGNQRQIEVALQPQDQLVLFTKLKTPMNTEA